MCSGATLSLEETRGKCPKPHRSTDLGGATVVAAGGCGTCVRETFASLPRSSCAVSIVRAGAGALSCPSLSCGARAGAELLQNDSLVLA